MKKKYTYEKSLIEKQINKYKFLLYRSKNPQGLNKPNQDRIQFYKRMLNALNAELQYIAKQ